jgi:cytidylate kinase
MIKVLTIEREYGSGASPIAQKAAARLGWKLWDQALTDEIARFLKCDRRHVEQHEERRDPLHYRLLKSFVRGSFEGSMNTPNMQIADAEGIRYVSERTVRRVAEEGNAVIVGRGAAYYLQSRTDAFHVFLYAPFEEKVRRLRRDGKSEQEAADLVENVDRERTVFIKEHFGIEWPSRTSFHLMINSAMGDEKSAEIVVNGLKAFEKAD